MTEGQAEGPGSGRLLLAEYGTLLIVVLVVLVAVGGFFIYTVQTAPETETETDSEIVETWTASSSFSHSAEVQRDTAVFAAGERLHDRPLYFSQLMPQLDGSYEVTYSGDVDSATVSLSLERVIRSAEEIDDGVFVHWEERETIATETVDGLAPGESATVEFGVDTNDTSNRVSTIEDDLGASPGQTEVLVVAETTLQGEAADWSPTVNQDDQLELELGGGTYSVSTDVGEAVTEERTEVVEREVPVEHSALEEFGGPLLVVFGLLGLLGIGYARYTGWPDIEEDDRQRVSFDRAREDYDDWISTGRLPESDNRTRVTLDSLEDLVDVAIDSNSRVIEHGDGPSYAVLAGDVRYVYAPPWVATDDGESEKEDGPGGSDGASDGDGGDRDDGDGGETSDREASDGEVSHGATSHEEASDGETDDDSGTDGIEGLWSDEESGDSDGHRSGN